MVEFRRGDTNLLLATHVGAEGLDFGCCSRVVLLEVPDHVIQLTQVRGGKWGEGEAGQLT